MSWQYASDSITKGEQWGPIYRELVDALYERLRALGVHRAGLYIRDYSNYSTIGIGEQPPSFYEYQSLMNYALQFYCDLREDTEEWAPFSSPLGVRRWTQSSIMDYLGEERIVVGAYPKYDQRPQHFVEWLIQQYKMLNVLRNLKCYITHPHPAYLDGAELWHKEAQGNTWSEAVTNFNAGSYSHMTNVNAWEHYAEKGSGYKIFRTQARWVGYPYMPYISEYNVNVAFNYADYAYDIWVLLGHYAGTYDDPDWGTTESGWAKVVENHEAGTLWKSAFFDNDDATIGEPLVTGKMGYTGHDIEAHLKPDFQYKDWS